MDNIEDNVDTTVHENLTLRPMDAPAMHLSYRVTLENFDMHRQALKRNARPPGRDLRPPPVCIRKAFESVFYSHR